MLKRTVSGTVLMLLITSMLTLAFNIQPARAWTGRVYIRADGSIDPPDAPITTYDNVTYTLTSNITSFGNGIVIERNNLVIEGASYMLQGNGSGTGINLSGRNNVTIKSIEIEDYRYGIHLQNSSKNTIVGNKIIANNDLGIWFVDSSNNNISRNEISNNEDSIWLAFCSNSSISGNIITKSRYGIGINGGSRNIITDNNVTNNKFGIWLFGSLDNYILRNNIINNKYGVYPDLGSEQNSFSENNIISNEYGVHFFSSRNNKFYHNNIINNTEQVEIIGSFKNIWDDGYPLGGNYWSDYNGTDSNGDGIGDVPYIIDENNTDRYPLMHPWASLPVHNMNTGLGYETIQEAIDTNETLNGHTIFAEAGIYRELVVINKTLRLIGESQLVTIIDGWVDVKAKNVIINGFAVGGFTAFITGRHMSFGIRLSDANCRISNNTVFNTGCGICLLNSTNNMISNNVLIANVYNNVYLSESSNNTISQNYIKSIEWKGGIRLMYSGIRLDRSSNNTIIQNNITQCKWGIKIEGRTSQYVSNKIIGNNIGYFAHDNGIGILLYRSSNSTITRNKIIPLGPYWNPEDSIGILFRCSFNNSITKNHIERNGEGINLEDSSLNNLTDNNLMNNFYGILLQGSQVNSLIRNNITHSPVIITPEHGGSNKTVRVGYGILIRLCYYGANTLRYNNITGYMYNFGVEGYMDRYVQDVDATNTVDGKPIYYWVNRQNGQIPSDAGYVAIVNSTNIRVEGLNLKNNYQGILIAYSNNTTIRQNNVTNNRYGIGFEGSSNNSIYGNNVINNYLGVWLGVWVMPGVPSNYNKFYHNNFIDNTYQAYVYESFNNFWDDGYPSGGNYWSNYNGTDLYSGPYQNVTGSDGIGDTAYTIDANNTDGCPLMAPINIFEAGVWNETAYTVDIVSNSTVSDFHFNPDEGPFLKFNVTGDNGTAGFCRVTIPKDLLWVEDGWTVYVGDELITDYMIIPNENCTYLYFNYNHSTKTVQIIGTHVTPEFSTIAILLLFMISTLIAVIVVRKMKVRYPKLGG